MIDPKLVSLAFENAHLKQRVQKLSEEKERARVALTDVEDRFFERGLLIEQLRLRNGTLTHQRDHAWRERRASAAPRTPTRTRFSLGTLLVTFMIGLVAGAGGLVLASHFF